MTDELEHKREQIPPYQGNDRLLRDHLRAANLAMTDAVTTGRSVLPVDAITAAEAAAIEILNAGGDIHPSVMEEAQIAWGFVAHAGMTAENLKKVANMRPHSGSDNPPQR